MDYLTICGQILEKYKNTTSGVPIIFFQAFLNMFVITKSLIDILI